MSGVIGIIKSWPIIKAAIMRLNPKNSATAMVQNEVGKSAETAEEMRTDKDLPFKIIAVGTVLTLIVTFIFFWLGVMNNLLFAVVGILLVAVIAFLVTTVIQHRTGNPS